MPHFGAVCSELLTTFTAAAAAKSLQSCSTLCDPIDGSLPGSTVLGILQARTLEWVAIAFSNAWKWKVKVKSLSHVWLFTTLWTAAYQAPPSMGFPRQEYWSGLPLPSPNHKKEWIFAVCSNMDGLQEHYAKWNVKEKQILYDVTYVWNLKSIQI